MGETADQESERVSYYWRASPEERIILRFDVLSDLAYEALGAGNNDQFEARKSTMCVLAAEYPEAHLRWLELRLKVN